MPTLKDAAGAAGVSTATGKLSPEATEQALKVMGLSAQPPGQVPPAGENHAGGGHPGAARAGHGARHGRLLRGL